MKHRALKIAVGLTLFSNLCFAIDNSIQIESDKAHYFHEKGTMVHEGHVVVHWQQRVLYADKLTILKGQNGQVTHLRAKGKPASFHGAFSPKINTIKGHANVIHFKIDDNIITLKDSAQLNYDGDLFEGPLISFNFNTNNIIAQKNETTRPKLTFGTNLKDRLK